MQFAEHVTQVSVQRGFSRSQLKGGFESSNGVGTAAETTAHKGKLQESGGVALVQDVGLKNEKKKKKHEAMNNDG